jgi:hypothetical protein
MQNKLNAYIDPPSRDACTWGLTLELSGGEAVRLERVVRAHRRGPEIACRVCSQT